MIVTINLESCNDCRHLSHTGAFTEGGAKPCCNHDGSNCFNRLVPHKMFVGEGGTGYVIGEIPDWCPLKNEGSY